MVQGVAWSPSALAQKARKVAPDEEARALQRRAMTEEYLATEFPKALADVERAIEVCGASRCSSTLRAELRRDRAVLLHANKSSRDAIVKAFLEALRIDTSVALDPNVTSAPLEGLFRQAKQEAVAAGWMEGTTGIESSFLHTAPPEQAVRTPVPIYAEYTGTTRLARVVIRYKGVGAKDWSTADTRRISRGYGGYIPCEDVVKGELVYLLEGLDSEGKVIASGGDVRTPYQVAIRDSLEGTAPRLPGQAPPTLCTAGPDTTCKPGDTACAEKASKTLRRQGEQCARNEECSTNTCRNGACDAPPKPYSKFWLGAEGGLDVLFVPAATNVCKLDEPKLTPTGDTGYYCTNLNGGDYPSRNGREENNRIVRDAPDSNQVGAGASIGTIRANIAFDYALDEHILVGARLGYVLNRYSGVAAKEDSKTFAPVHLEVRGTYVLGKEPLAREGMFKYAFVGLGASEFEASVPLDVVEKGDSKVKAGIVRANAWYIVGGPFLSLGAGIRYATSPSSAFLLALKLTVASGGGQVAPVIGPEMGFHFGL
jgi:hypothetical protein